MGAAGAGGPAPAGPGLAASKPATGVASRHQGIANDTADAVQSMLQGMGAGANNKRNSAAFPFKNTNEFQARALLNSSLVGENQLYNSYVNKNERASSPLLTTKLRFSQ